MYKNFFDGYEAVIFDLDGTVVKDEFAWDESVENIFSKEIISEKPYYGERGQNLRAKILNILRRNTFRTRISEESYYQLICNEYFKHIDTIEITSGFEQFANFLKNKNIKLVLVTNSDSVITNFILERKGIKKYFDLIISEDSVVLPKPAPYIYEYAVQQIKVPKNKILVFEDSVLGLKSAENANLKTIVVLPNGKSIIDYGSKNRVFIDSFEDINENININSDDFILDFFSK